MAEQAAPRKAGRPRTGQKVRKYTVMLPPELHEWAMEQPGGISELVRRLLCEERQKSRRA